MEFIRKETKTYICSRVILSFDTLTTVSFLHDSSRPGTDDEPIETRSDCHHAQYDDIPIRPHKFSCSVVQTEECERSEGLESEVVREQFRLEVAKLLSRECTICDLFETSFAMIEGKQTKVNSLLHEIEGRRAHDSSNESMPQS